MKFDVRTTVLGGMLSLTTAVGCVFYERLVKNHSFLVISVLRLIEDAIIIPIAFWLYGTDGVTISSLATGRFALWAGIYMLTAITTPLWFMLTRETNVAVAASWEGTYVLVLLVIGVIGGLEGFSIRHAIGCGLMFGGVLVVGWR